MLLVQVISLPKKNDSPAFLQADGPIRPSLGHSFYITRSDASIRGKSLITGTASFARKMSSGRGSGVSYFLQEPVKQPAKVRSQSHHSSKLSPFLDQID